MTTMAPNDIKAILPQPHYQCEGADNMAPDSCSTVHFRDETGGYFPPDDLHYLEVSEHDTAWQGFFCISCKEAIAKSDPNCKECGHQVHSCTDTGITLKQVLETAQA